MGTSQHAFESSPDIFEDLYDVDPPYENGSREVTKIIPPPIDKIVPRYQGDILPTSLANGRVIIDHLGYEIEVDGKPAPLTLTELKVMEVLITNRDKFLSNDQINIALYGVDIMSNIPTTYISYLRKKMGKELGQIIVTKNRTGYRIDDSSI